MKHIWWVLALAAIVVLGAVYFAPRDTADRAIPGEAFAQHKDLIRLMHPLPEGMVSSPLVVRGEARGMWFFEADFPVVLTDWNGLIIAEGIATAEGEWMTEEYVPFTATLTFTPNTTVSNRGSLILLKDNPTGLPEFDDAFEITVFFEEDTPAHSGNPTSQCFVSGCSSHICSDEPDVITTCEWREEYACYRSARCERQADGACGWTETPELLSCLNTAQG